MIKHQEHP